jgi:hypothetical protein
LNAGVLLRTDASTNIGAVTIGSGLSFDGTTLTATGGAGSTNFTTAAFGSATIGYIYFTNSLNLSNILIGSGNGIFQLSNRVTGNLPLYINWADDTVHLSAISGSSAVFGQTVTAYDTITAPSFVGSSTDTAGTLMLQATNATGAIAFTLPATHGASNVFNFTVTTPAAGEVFKVKSVSGNVVTLTNDVPHPLITTNSIWIGAGAWAPYGGSTLEGGRNGAAAGSYTNAGSVVDTWDMDDGTNEAVSATFSPRGFAGGVLTDIHWLSHSPLDGTSNSVWQVAVSQMASNSAFGTFSYFTNVTASSYVSNRLQITRLPLITVTNLSPAELLTFRITRLGTNTGDVVVGDARFLGARISFTRTNWLGGYP